MGFKEVLREPVVRESDDILGILALIADLSVRGVWQPQTAVLFNVCIVDTDTQSYLSCSVCAILSSAEQEKKILRSSFVPRLSKLGGDKGQKRAW